MKILLLNHVNSCLTVVFLTVLPSTIFRDLECSCWNVLRVEIHWNWISRSKNHWNYFRRTFTGNMAYHKFMVFSGKNLPQSNSKEVFGLDRQSHEIRGTSLSPVIYFRLLLAAYHRHQHLRLKNGPRFPINPQWNHLKSTVTWRSLFSSFKIWIIFTVLRVVNSMLSTSGLSYTVCQWQ